ncbi:MAG: toxin-antitoxin system [Myxococcota bacterium]
MGVKLESGVRRRLKALGKAKDRSPHWLIKSAVLEYLDREEQVESEHQEDHKRWEDYLLTGQAFSQERVMTWLEDLRRGRRRKWPK